MIRGILIALTSVLMVGCAGRQPVPMVSLPSVLPVKKAVKDAHTSSTETKDAVAKTKVVISQAVASAQAASQATGEADFLLKIAPVIEQLQEAQKINEEALAAATVAESRASTAGAQVEALEAKQATAEVQNAKQVERLNYLEPKYGEAVGKLWFWRIAAYGTWAVIALLILGKFYFRLPFL